MVTGTAMSAPTIPKSDVKTITVDDREERMDLDRLLEDPRRDQVVLDLLVKDEHDTRDDALPRLLEQADDHDGDRAERGADVGDQVGDADEERRAAAAYGNPSSFIVTKVVSPAMTPMRNLPYQ